MQCMCSDISPFRTSDLPRQERDGWYSTYAFEQIKSVLRYKFFSLLSGHIPTREECEARLVPAEEATKTNVRASSHRLRPGKHNMAKGALRPEDAAVRIRSDFSCSVL